MINRYLKVLVVEDSEDDTFLLERELKRGGFIPTILRVEKEADIVAALQSPDWDIVISDHNIPGISSEVVLDLVQSSGLGVPFIIVSGSIGEDIAVSAMRTGAHDYIMKDNLARLVPAINRELREAENRRAHKKAQEVINHLAYHDSLTGLSNRHVIEERINRLLTDDSQDQASHVLLYIDLDQFKVINDTSGHVAGDELLKQLARLLKGLIRTDDVLSRLGGDEFGVLLKSCGIQQAESIAKNILSVIQDFKFVWDTKTFTVGASIGLVEFTGHMFKDMTSVLSAADMACYAAKDLGRNRIHIYSEEEVNILRRQGEMLWVSIINEALQKDRFCLYQQKIISLAADGAEEYQIEFLIRMLDHHGEIILPGAFIPAAERYNLMNQVDCWVIKHAFAAFAQMQKLSSAPRMAFINLSGVSFCDENTLTVIKQELSSTSIEPGQICFEVTETAAIANLSSAVTFIEELKQLGFHFALDDFGVGLSSFSYLKSLPIDYLKVDGGFIRDMLTDSMDAAIVESISKIGHVAGLKTIAEFVESEAILMQLKKLNFDLAQGYAIHVPEEVKITSQDLYFEQNSPITL